MSPITIAIGATIVGLGIAPQDDVVRESVDLIELNHFYDEHGRLVFDQVIFYDWAAGEARYNVRAWRLVKNPAQLPQRDWRLGGYSAMWQDGEQIRYIHSKSIRETWTQYDPELVEREYLPKERRKELRTVRMNRPPAANAQIAAPSLPQPQATDPTATAAIAR
ncbi:MAG: hypothetical protein JF612_02375 [Planctomycetia bacterium]|nr:hypothetical protein [Planctomycetia bacterium]